MADTAEEEIPELEASEQAEVENDNSEDVSKPAENPGETEENSATEACDTQDTQDAADKTEEEIEQELKETRISITRYAPHTLPAFDVNEMKEHWMWHLRIYPIDQEDCRNCILDAATKISQEAFYYVPKRKNGPGFAELCMSSNQEASSVMARIVRMPFYHQYVTLEITRRSSSSETLEDKNATYVPFDKIEESASVVLDSTKCEKIKNTATSKGNQLRRSLWVRYLSENTSSEFLRVLFPLSKITEVQTHDSLRIGFVEANSKTDVLIFMKAYVTVVINNTHIVGIQNKEPDEKECDYYHELAKSSTPFTDLLPAPTEAADRTEQRKDEKNQTSRVLKRTLQQQQRMMDGRRRDQKRGRGEPPAKRGTGNWGDGRFDRRSGGGGRFGGFGGGGGGGGGGGFYPGRSGFGGMMNPEDMAAEMMMMQAQLNQTIQNQLMMLSPGSRNHGGYGGPRFGSGGGGGGGGGGGRRGGRRSGRGGGHDHFGGGW